jgi:DNA replication initiation complex subunit (GINS family)
MTDEEISYRLLRKIQQMEKNSPVLTDLDDDFYSNLEKYFFDLNAHLNSESDDNKKKLLEEEIVNTKKIIISIYEQREKKILLTAISKARGGSPDVKSMANVERDFFDSIFGLISTFRGKILENKKTINENKVEPEQEIKKLTEEKNKKVENENETKILKKNNLNPITRVIKDIPSFVGTDAKSYTLKKNDVVSLPEDMQEMLSKRKVVEKLEL